MRQIKIYRDWERESGTTNKIRRELTATICRDSTLEINLDLLRESLKGHYRREFEGVVLTPEEVKQLADICAATLEGKP